MNDLIVPIYEALRTIILSTIGLEDDSFSRLAFSLLETEQRREEGGFPLSTLPLQTCRAAGGEAEDALPAAVAWRALHLAAKLFDDVEDGDEVILGNKPLPPPVAINLATSFVAVANSALAAMPPSWDRGLPLALIEAFNRTILQMAAGQHLDITQQGQLDIEGYRQIMSAKSGEFFMLAAWAGARCATADEEKLSQFEAFGYNLGMMLQLNDDLGDFRKKNVGDIARGHYTFPVFYALVVASPPERERLQHWLRQVKEDPQAETEVRIMVRSLGGEVYVMAEAMRYKRRAQRALDALDIPAEDKAPLESWLHRLSLHYGKLLSAK